MHLLYDIQILIFPSMCNYMPLNSVFSLNIDFIFSRGKCQNINNDFQSMVFYFVLALNLILFTLSCMSLKEELSKA